MITILNFPRCGVPSVIEALNLDAVFGQEIKEIQEITMAEFFNQELYSLAKLQELSPAGGGHLRL